MANKFDQLREAFQMLMNRGYVPVFSMNILLQLLGFGSTVMVAKFLLPAELAIVKTAQAYAAVAVILAGVGLTAPVLRFCADSRIGEEVQQAMLRTALTAVAWVSFAVVAMILLAVSGTAAGGLTMASPGFCGSVIKNPSCSPHPRQGLICFIHLMGHALKRPCA